MGCIFLGKLTALWQHRTVILGYHCLIWWPVAWSTSNDLHYSEVIMSMMASQITNVSIVYWTVCSGANQRKHQSSVSLAFARGIHWWPVNSTHKGAVMWKMFPFDYVIMWYHYTITHQGRVTHICLIIGSDNGLLPGQCQAIIWINTAILLIGPLGRNFSEILIRIQTFSFKKKSIWKMPSPKWPPFCLGLNVLKQHNFV